MSPASEPSIGPLAGYRSMAFPQGHERSRILMEAAGNLLTKAADRQTAGDEEAARKLVRRAVALPYDEFHEARPAIFWMDMEMYSRLQEQLERADDEDSRWIDRAETLLSGTSGVASRVVRGALHGILEDYKLSKVEERRVRQLVGDEAEVSNAATQVDEDADLTEVVLEVLPVLHRQLTLYAEDLEAERDALLAQRDALEAQVRAREDFETKR